MSENESSAYSGGDSTLTEATQSEVDAAIEAIEESDGIVVGS